MPGDIPLQQLSGDRCLDLADQAVGQGVDHLSEPVDRPGLDVEVQVHVFGERRNLAVGLAGIVVVRRTGLGEQMQGVRGDTASVRQLIGFGRPQTGGGVRIVAVARPGVTDQDDVAAAELVPGRHGDRLDQAGDGVFVEPAGRAFRRRYIADLVQEHLDRLIHLQRRVGLGRVIQLGRNLGIVAVSDHAEAHPVGDVAVADSGGDPAHRFPGPLDIRSHGNRGVDDEDDTDLEVRQRVFLRGCIGDHRAAVQRHRRHFQDARGEAGGQPGGFRLQDRQQIELLGDVDILSRLDRDHRRIHRQGPVDGLLAQFAGPGQQQFGLQKVDQRLPVLEHQCPVAARRVGEGDHHGLAPIDGLVSHDPAFGRAPLRLAHLQPLRPVDHLAIEHVEYGESRDPGIGGIGGGQRLTAQCGARTAQDPLEQRLPALHQQRCTLLGRYRHRRHERQEHSGQQRSAQSRPAEGSDLGTS